MTEQTDTGTGRSAGAAPNRRQGGSAGTATLRRNREQQAALYGEPLGTLLARLGEQLGLNQARIAMTLGLSAPMLSQLASGQRVKIGNPLAVQRLQALYSLGMEVAVGRVPQTDVDAELASIMSQAAVDLRSTTSGSHRSPAAGARLVQSLFHAIASAEDLLAAAALIEVRYPEIATVLRVYGAGRTADAIAHFEEYSHLL